MVDIMEFAIESARREAEICRIQWAENDDAARTCLVRDAKHPTAKDGNHRTFKYSISANILYAPTNVVSHTFGRTTPGNVASGGLRADFIRGSRFDSTATPVRGTSLYLGVVSDEVTIQAGTPARWVRFAVPRTLITDGPYEIFVWTGGTQAVARYYASSDRDNWDGAPLSFSASAPDSIWFPAFVLQPGKTTLSVYAEFLQGN